MGGQVVGVRVAGGEQGEDRRAGFGADQVAMRFGHFLQDLVGAEQCLLETLAAKCAVLLRG